jgi:hypothetical protein
MQGLVTSMHLMRDICENNLMSTHTSHSLLLSERLASSSVSPLLFHLMTSPLAPGKFLLVIYTPDNLHLYSLDRLWLHYLYNHET